MQEDALDGLVNLVGELRQGERRMMQGVETEFDRKSLVVRLHMRFRRRGGRKWIVLGRQR